MRPPGRRPRSDEGFDLAIIGAGPAGMAAAVTAAELDLDAVLIDEQPAPGGTRWRHAERLAEDRPRDVKALGRDLQEGLRLISRVRAARRIDQRYASTVWDVSGDRVVAVSQGGTSALLTCRRIIVATGAYERPFPLPGATLPGVMTTGAVRAAFQVGGILPTGRLVVAGHGHGLVELLGFLAEMGIRPTAVLDSSGSGRLTHMSPLLSSSRGAGGRFIRRGLAILSGRARAGGAVYRRVRSIRVQGEGRLEAVEFETRGRRKTIEADILAVHHGIVPNTQIGRLLGLTHLWDEHRATFLPELDEFGQSSVPQVFMAGSAGAVEGWRSSVARGELAALAVARDLNAIDEDELTRRIRAPMRRRQRAARSFQALERRFPLHPQSPQDLPDETILCRCEEVTVGEVRAALRAGAPGPNQVKAFTRCGMGSCQGRACSLPLTQIVSEMTERHPSRVGALRVRPPLVPVTLGEIAGLSTR